jgi:cullin-5
MPADYVNKLARMFQDIKVSDDLNQEFKDAHRNNNEGIAGKNQCHLRALRCPLE